MAEDEKDPRIEIEEPGSDTFAGLVDRLGRENLSRSPWDRRTFTLVLRAQGGRLIGGAHAILNMGLVEVRGLWVDPARRGEGLGRSLLAALEREAAARGVTRVALDTYDWQARRFYEKLGYRVFGTLRYPAGPRRFYMEKDLVPQA